MQARIPMNASAPPMGWLIFSGLTVHAFFETETVAMSDSLRGVNPGLLDFPRRRPSYLLPYRIVQSFVDFVNQIDHSVISGVSVVALLVDVEPGHLRFQRDKLRTSAGEHDIGARFLQNLIHLARREVVEHVSVVAHDLFDAFFVFLGGFLHAGAYRSEEHTSE